MRPHEGRGARARAGTFSTPKYQSGTTGRKPRAYPHVSAQMAKVNVAGSRMRSRLRFTIENAIVWMLFTFIVGVLLIAACVLLTLVAPS